MLDFLYKLFNRTEALGNMSIITGHIADIIEIFEQEYQNDHDAYNASLDSLIRIIQDHKKPSQTTQTTPK